MECKLLRIFRMKIGKQFCCVFSTTAGSISWRRRHKLDNYIARKDAFIRKNKLYNLFTVLRLHQS